jgi:hypothetical protein
MDRRGLLLLAAALAAGVLLLLLGRPGGGDQTGSVPPAATVPPAPPAAAPPAARPPAAEVTASALPAPSESSEDTPAPEVEPPDRESGVVGEETLDSAAAGDAVAVAERFAAAWSTPDPDWHDRLAELATPALAASLAGADPPQPAREITGAGEVYFEDGPEWARIGVPAQRGTVVLDVVAVDGRWLVSAVDWWPA